MVFVFLKISMPCFNTRINTVIIEYIIVITILILGVTLGIYSTWFFLCLILIILIFLIIYTRKDLEALIISSFIIMAYFFLKLIIYFINFVNSQDLMSNLGSGFLTFLKYLTACLVFTLVFVVFYPFIKRR